MQIEQTQLTKLTLTELEALDPVSVIVEDYVPGKGKIIIECYGQSWSAYWGGMSGRCLADFFCSCDEHYIAGKLSSINAEVDDFDALTDKVRKEIIKLRRERELDKWEARDFWGEAGYLDCHSSVEMRCGIMQRVFGDEWWYCIPTKQNHHYEYLCRIIKAVQAAFQQLKPEQKLAS